MGIVRCNITFNNSLVPNALVKTSQNIPADCTVALIKRNLECVRRSRYICRRKAFVKHTFGCCREVKIRVNTAILEKGGRTKCARDNPER